MSDLKERSKYPECEKLSRMREQQMVLVGFLDWLEEQGLVLATMHGSYSKLTPSSRKPNDLIMEYLKVDQGRLEKERRAMLDVIRKEAS